MAEQQLRPLLNYPPFVIRKMTNDRVGLAYFPWLGGKAASEVAFVAMWHGRPAGEGDRLDGKNRSKSGGTDNVSLGSRGLAYQKPPECREASAR